jgi:preprotein translocase subunit YajC
VLIALYVAAFALLGWFLLVRPQRVARQRAATLRSSLVPGETVVTVGGLIGEIVEIEGREVDLEVAPDVVLTVLADSIAGRYEAPGEEEPSDEVDLEAAEQDAEDAPELPEPPVETVPTPRAGEPEPEEPVPGRVDAPPRH